MKIPAEIMKIDNPIAEPQLYHEPQARQGSSGTASR